MKTILEKITTVFNPDTSIVGGILPRKSETTVWSDKYGNRYYTRRIGRKKYSVLGIMDREWLSFPIMETETDLSVDDLDLWCKRFPMRCCKKILEDPTLYDKDSPLLFSYKRQLEETS